LFLFLIFFAEFVRDAESGSEGQRLVVDYASPETEIHLVRITN
jgi:hypothetical protein